MVVALVVVVEYYFFTMHGMENQHYTIPTSSSNGNGDLGTTATFPQRYV